MKKEDFKYGIRIMQDIYARKNIESINYGIEVKRKVLLIYDLQYEDKFIEGVNFLPKNNRNPYQYHANNVALTEEGILFVKKYID